MKKRRGFVLLLCTAVLAVSLSVSVSAAFSDIPETAWYAPAVEYVQENGIMNGEGEDRFDPEGKMTRRHVCTGALSYDGKPGQQFHGVLVRLFRCGSQLMV